MSSPILVTKLFIPATRPELVTRPHLIERLDEGLNRKLTLISAPAGFGKSTLVAEWINTKGGDTSSPFCVAWVSLDENDNDPVRFLTYLVEALNRIEEIENEVGTGVITMLRSPQPPPSDTVLTTLINEIAVIECKIFLVLDDYHLIEAQAVHDALTFLLENLPPQLHLIIATREDPLLPISRLRVRNQITELRATDLRFTPAEAADFLNQVMGLDLSPDEICALEARTEGWIAGLQLAAISLKDQANTSRLIQTFTGSNRLVLDYLMDEVLNQQPTEIQDFLLQTAILNRLSSDLCTAITGLKNTQEILEKLEHANLFIIPLDADRQWYRYHHLFADLLRQQLQRSNLQSAPKLHLQASEWYEQNDLVDEAIQHALSAEDYTRCAALLSELADPLWERGEHVKLRNWLARLPEHTLCAKPLLCIFHSWFLFSTGQQEAAQNLLQAVEDAIATTPNQSSSMSEMEQLKMRGRLGAVWSLICTWQEDLAGIIQHASLALKHLSEGDPWRRMAAMALGDAQYYEGDVQTAYQTRLETQAACHPEDDLFFYMIANLKVATSLRELGRLNEAIEICQQQLDFAKEHGLLQTVFVGWAYTIWAIALAEQNKLDQALEFADKSLVLNLGGDFAFLCFSYIVLAKIYFYRGDYATAESNLQQLAEIERTNDIPFYMAGSFVSWQARLMLTQNQLDEAAEWITAQDCQGDLKKLITYDHIIVVKTRLLLAQEKWDEALDLLVQLQAACEAIGHTARLIEILALQAIARQGLGEKLLAQQTLGSALTLAEPGGFIRVFVDEGPPMARLLYGISSQANDLAPAVSPSYIQRLLAAFPDVEAEQNSQPKNQSSDAEWIEPLTERELEVLQLIANGLTNQDIASKLYLSLNTVKAHTRSIYGKLVVKSRTQAIVRARALGLISSD